MNSNRNRDIVGLVITGCVFIAVNALVFMGSRTGRIAPVDNLLLWGVFATFSVFALLWVIRLLGLQPIIVAVSYAAGGFLAFQGVKLMPNVHVAEVATAGATYGAFGALVVGGATAKVRLAFLNKQQVPFVVVILALLLVDALLNSRVSHAGWGVVANALVLPFLLSGVVVGLAWMVVVRVHAWRKSLKELAGQTEEETVIGSVQSDAEMAPLMFSAPESSDEDEIMEPAAFKTKHVREAPVVLAESSCEEEEASDDNFFPLEIDNGEDAVFAEEDGSLMDLAAMVAESAPELVGDEEPLVEQEIPLQKPISSEENNELPAEEAPVADPEPQTIEVEPEETISEENKKVDSNDWLSSHLDLLNKLK